MSDPDADPPQPGRVQIFLSYGRDEHRAFAQQLYDDLTRSGYEVWFDADRLVPGIDWEDAIDKGLAEAAQAQGWIVMVMTPHAVRRPDGYCLNEIARALGRGLKPLPIMLVWCEPPLSVCRVQYLDMQDCARDVRTAVYTAKYDRLLRAIRHGDIDYEGGHTAVRKALDPLEFRLELKRVPGYFVGREVVMGKVRDWLSDDSRGKLLTLVGTPGIGKTALSAHIAHTFHEISAVHFCSSHDTNKVSPRKFVCTLAHTLFTQLRFFRDSLSAEGIEKAAAASAGSVEALFKELVGDRLTGVERPGRSVVLLIDALDEATMDRVNEIAQLLSTAYIQGWLPSWFRTIVTTRPASEVLRRLVAVDPNSVDLGMTGNNESDLKIFVTRELGHLTRDEAVLQAAVVQLVERAEGLFLYAHYVCAAIREGHLSLTNPERFPIGLNDAYFRYCKCRWPVTKKVERDGETREIEDPALVDKYANEAQPALAIVTAAREALSTDVLCGALGWDAARLDRFLVDAGSLVAVAEGKVAVFHKTFLEWITSERSRPHTVNVANGHWLIAEHALGEIDAGVGSTHEYLLRHAVRHIVEARGVRESERWQSLLGLFRNFEYLGWRMYDGLGFGLIEDFELVIREFSARNQGREQVVRLAQACARSRLFVARMHEKHGDECRQAFIQSLWNLRYQIESGEALAQRPEGRLQAKPTARKSPASFAALVDEWLECWKRENCGVLLHARHSVPLDLDSESACLHGHYATVTSLDLSPSSDRVVSASGDGAVRVWGVATGKSEPVFEGLARVLCVRFREEGRLLTAIDSSGLLVTLDFRGGSTKQEQASMELSAAAISDRGAFAVLASTDGRLSCWDLNRMAEVWHRNEPSCEWTCVAMAEGCHVLAGNAAGEVWTLDGGAGALVGKRTPHSGAVRSLATDGACIFTGGDDGRLLRWRPSEDGAHELFHSTTDSVAALALSNQDGSLVWGLGGLGVRRWPMDRTIYARGALDDAGAPAEFFGNVDATFAVCATATTVCAGGLEQRVRIWQRDRKIRRTDPRFQYVNMLRSESTTGFVTASDDALRVWDARSLSWSVRIDHGGAVYAAATTPDRRLICSAGFGREVKLWARADGVRVAAIATDTKSNIGAVFDATGRLLVFGDVGDYDEESRRVDAEGPEAPAPQYLSVWDVPAGQCVSRFEAGKSMEYRRALSVTPDNKALVGPFGAREIGVWTLPGGVLVERFSTGLDGETIAIALHPTGTRLAVSDKEGGIRILTLCGRFLYAIKHHQEHVRGLTFSRDGEVLIAGCDDHTVTIWLADKGEFLAAVDLGDWITDIDLLGARYEWTVALAGAHIARVKVLDWVEPRPAWVTAVRLWEYDVAGAHGEVVPGAPASAITAVCPSCDLRFDIPDPVLARLRASQDAAGARIASLELMPEAWRDQGISGECPGCGWSLRYNPFVVEFDEPAPATPLTEPAPGGGAEVPVANAHIPATRDVQLTGSYHARNFSRLMA